MLWQSIELKRRGGRDHGGGGGGRDCRLLGRRIGLIGTSYV